jgi:hypothetical protein
MADHPQARRVLVVVGSTLRAEELDRPLGYFLRQRIEQAWDAAAGPVQVLVIADFRWLHEEALQALPTISVGGPGVNALAQECRSRSPWRMNTTFKWIPTWTTPAPASGE